VWGCGGEEERGRDPCRAATDDDQIEIHWLARLAQE
jgi:hypothetical protein